MLEYFGLQIEKKVDSSLPFNATRNLDVHRISKPCFQFLHISEFTVFLAIFNLKSFRANSISLYY